MDNHKMDNHKDSSMTWMMFICCVLPIFVLLFFWGTLSSLLSGGYLVLILVGACVLAHVAMTLRGRGKGRGEHHVQGGSDAGSVQQPTAKDEHKHGGCCH